MEIKKSVTKVLNTAGKVAWAIANYPYYLGKHAAYSYATREGTGHMLAIIPCLAGEQLIAYALPEKYFLPVRIGILALRLSEMGLGMLAGYLEAKNGRDFDILGLKPESIFSPQEEIKSLEHKLENRRLPSQFYLKSSIAARKGR